MRGDLEVADDGVRRKPRIGVDERISHKDQTPVLSCRIGSTVGAFELDTDSKVVAGGPTSPRRRSGMPGAPIKRHILRTPAPSVDQQVARHLEPFEIGKRGYRFGVEFVEKQPIDHAVAKLAGGQRDAMHDD